MCVTAAIFNKMEQIINTRTVEKTNLLLRPPVTVKVTDGSHDKQ
jgi:hypothetical protein